MLRIHDYKINSLCLIAFHCPLPDLTECNNLTECITYSIMYNLFLITEFIKHIIPIFLFNPYRSSRENGYKNESAHAKG